MTPEELEQAVDAPGGAGRRAPGSGLAAAIVAEVSEQPGALPLHAVRPDRIVRAPHGSHPDPAPLTRDRRGTGRAGPPRRRGVRRA